MFDAHPDMAIPSESHFVVQFATRRSRYETAGGFKLERFTADLLDHWAFKRWHLPSGAVTEAYEAAPPEDVATAIRTLFATYARHDGKYRYGDKTPSYVLSIDPLAATFPEAVFIHLIRDGRDVALSYLETDFGSRTLGQAAIYWDRFVRAGRAAGTRLGADRYREVRYEDLVREPDRVLAELCLFVGLRFDVSMLRYHERADDALFSGGVPTEHHSNLKKPPTIGLRDWRRDLPPKDVEVFESLAGELLDELGYERGAVHRSWVARLTAARFRLGTQGRRFAHGARVRGRKLRRKLVRKLAGHRPVEDRTTTRIP